MSTTPIVEPQQQAAPFLPTQQAYTSHSGHGSVGPVIGVLAIIIILGALAIMVGRLCSGRRIMGHGQYDFESWVETKCATCLDGRVDPVPTRIVIQHPPAPVETGEMERGEERREQESEEHEHEHDTTNHHDRNEC
ncbi:hypothetical protein ACET3Z_022011 [Daucus carota]